MHLSVEKQLADVIVICRLLRGRELCSDVRLCCGLFVQAVGRLVSLSDACKNSTLKVRSKGDPMSIRSMVKY